MAKRNPFTKEYVSGRKDQLDRDYAIFRKCAEETSTKEDLVNMLEEKLKSVISRVAYERANELIEEIELI